MQTRQWLVREVQRLHEHSTVHPNDLTRGDVCRVRKHARQKEELLPTSHARGEARGDERERQCMEGFCCCFVVVFSAYMTVKSTTLSEVRQNSSLHLVNRNTRGEGGTQIHKKQQQDNQEGVSTRTPCASGVGQSTLILRTMTFHCR